MGESLQVNSDLCEWDRVCLHVYQFILMKDAPSFPCSLSHTKLNKEQYHSGESSTTYLSYRCLPVNQAGSEMFDAEIKQTIFFSTVMTTN